MQVSQGQPPQAAISASCKELIPACLSPAIGHGEVKMAKQVGQPT